MSGAQRCGSAGMDRRPSPHRENWAAWVSLPAVWPGWIAGRTPRGFGGMDLPAAERRVGFTTGRDGSPADRTPRGFHYRLFGGMDRRPSPHRENWAAWVSLPAVWPGWIAARTPRGFRHRLLTAGGGTRVSAERAARRPAGKAREGGIPGVFRPKRNPERSEAEWFSRDGSLLERRLGFTTGCSHPYSPRQRERRPPTGAAARSAAKPRIAVLRRRPHVANPRKSPAKTLPSRTARRPPSFPSVEFLPVKTELSNDSAARPRAAQNRGPGAPRRGFLPPPNGAADPRSGASFPRYNPTRPPGRGSVWQSTWFGIRGSQVQILPPRRGPSPRRFRQTGSARRVPPDGFGRRVRQTGSGRRVSAPRRPRHPAVSDAFFPALSHPGRGRSLRHSPMVQNVYIPALLPETVRPGGCPFSCSCFLTFPNRV